MNEPFVKLPASTWQPYQMTQSEMQADGYSTWATRMEQLLSHIWMLEKRLEKATREEKVALPPDMQAELDKMRQEERDRCAAIAKDTLLHTVEDPTFVDEFAESLEKKLAAPDRTGAALKKKPVYNFTIAAD